MTATEPATIVIPPAPRQVTRRASRRAWGEASVRFWWKSAVGVALVTLVVAAGFVKNAIGKRQLMRDGIPVQATIVEVEGTGRPRFAVLRDHHVKVQLSVPMPNGETPLISTSLDPGSGYVQVGADVRVRVDPKRPSRLVEEAELEPWWRVVAVPMLMMLPLAAALMGLAEWRRRRVLAVWRRGAPGRGIVVDVSHSATAPRSRTLRYTLVDGADRRVFSMLYPTRAGNPQRGDLLDLIVLQERPQDAIVTELYAAAHAPPMR